MLCCIIRSFRVAIVPGQRVLRNNTNKVSQLSAIYAFSCRAMSCPYIIIIIRVPPPSAPEHYLHKMIESVRPVRFIAA